MSFKDIYMTKQADLSYTTTGLLGGILGAAHAGDIPLKDKFNQAIATGLLAMAALAMYKKLHEDPTVDNHFDPVLKRRDVYIPRDAQ